MSLDKFHYYDGLYYQYFIEPRFREIRKAVAMEVPSGSSVLDIGCGTGALAFELAENGVRTTGVDLSRRMIKHALDRQLETSAANVKFIHGDAAQMGGAHYDYTVISMALHEMTPNHRLQVVKKAKELADKVILADYASPLPLTMAGVRVRFGEFLSGIDHFSCFLDYQRSHGLDNLLSEAGLSSLNDFLTPNGTLRVVVAT